MSKTDDIYKEPNFSNVKTSISLNQSKLLQYFFDMGTVASTADDGFVVPAPIKVLSYGKNAEEKYQADKKIATETLRNNVKMCRKLDKKVEYKVFLFDEIRTIYPDFAQNMDKKVSPADYSLYIKNKKLLKNALFYGNQPDKISVANALLSYKDKLSSVIDTEEFSDACNIEDRFIISELDEFFKILNNKPEIEKKPFKQKKFKQEDKVLSVVDLADKLKHERAERISKYTEIKKLYEKIKSSKYISLQARSSNKERE
jgi:hypothetical protein